MVTTSNEMPGVRQGVGGAPAKMQLIPVAMVEDEGANDSELYSPTTSRLLAELKPLGVSGVVHTPAVVNAHVLISTKPLMAQNVAVVPVPVIIVVHKDV